MADSVRPRKIDYPCPVSVLVDPELHDSSLWLPSGKWLCDPCGVGGQLEGLLRLDTDVPEALWQMADLAAMADLDAITKVGHRLSLLKESSEPPRPSGRSPSSRCLKLARRNGHSRRTCPVSALLDPEPHDCRLLTSTGDWICYLCGLFGNLQGFLRLSADLSLPFLHLAARYRDGFLPDDRLAGPPRRSG